MSYRPGQAIGNYRLIRQLGHGGFADVYLGKHRHLQSEAALKVLHVSLSEEEAQRFLSEAQTLVRLRHPNIVRVLDYAVDRGMPVLIMDYAPGGTIRQRHPRGTVLSLAMTVSYIKQAAAALQYAHDRHIIHRDVKPDNILLGPDATLLLSDFGVALFSPSPELLSRQEMAGTLPYMAPEQIHGRPTFASDQYALGVMAYEWLCGKRPFEGKRWEIIDQHLTAVPPPLREQYPELPAAVERVVLRALAKKPQERFASVQDFADALEHASQADSADIDVDAEITLPHPKSAETAVTTPPQNKADVQTLLTMFLSADSADGEFFARLKTDLQAQGVLLANDGVVAVQEDEMRQAIRAANLVLVLLSPHTRASRLVKEHMRIANMYGRQIIFMWVAGEEVTTLLPIPETWGKTAVIDVLDARGPSYALALKKVVASLESDTEESTLSAPARSEPQREPRNPYKGLRAFTRDEAADFFGRDALIEKMVATLRSLLAAESPHMPSTRLLTVIGPSGSGKSSVVMAGLLPRLQKGMLPGSKQWIYLDPIVPGMQPLEALALALASRLPEKSRESIRDILSEDSAHGLHLLATQLVKRPGEKVLLVIDQFEEVFAQHLPEQEREHFLELLLTAFTEPGGPVVAVLTLRADCYDRPMRYPKLSRLIETHHVSVLPLALHDLRAVIEEPAAQPDVQLTFEGDLVGDLLFDTQGQPGALPLLEFTLDQLYQRREGHWLTLKAYQEIGGVQGALARHAESTYASLPSEEHRRLARTLFLRLFDPGVTEQDTTRRRASISELSLADEKQTRLLGMVADAFVTARLLTISEVAGETTIEVSHEALIREWRRLATWLHEAREDVLLQQTLSADVSDWLRRGKPADRLYRGTKLLEAQAWVERNVASADEMAFVRASAEEHQRLEQEELHRQAGELKLKRQTVNRLRAVVVVLTLLLVASIIFATVTRGLLNQVSDQAQSARSRALAAQANTALANGQIDKALLLGVKANQTQDTFDARDSLFSALEYSPRLLTMLHDTNSAVYHVSFGPDEQTLISAGSLDTRGEITFWNLQTKKGQTLALDFRGIVNAIPNWAISPDGQHVAGANDQGVWLWDARTGAQIARLETANPGDSISPINTTPLAFSPDGTLLASARCTQYSHDPNDDFHPCLQGQVLLWHVASQTPQHLFSGPALITHLAFSPDGKTLITSSKTLTPGSIGGKLQLWNVATGTVMTPSFANFSGIIWDFVLSPNGKTLAASDQAKSIYLWDMASQHALLPPIDAGNAQHLAFSPDGKMLAAGNADKTVQLWDVATGQPVDASLPGHQQPITDLTFSPNGKLLVSSDSDGTMLVWNVVTPGSSIQQLFKYPNQIVSAIFSPDGKMIVAGDSNGKITVSDAATGAILATLDATLNPGSTGSDTENPLAIKSLAFSSDKRILAAGRDDGMILVWDIATKQLQQHFHTVKQKQLQTIAFAPHSTILAASYTDGTILLWESTTGHVLHQIQHSKLQSGDTAPSVAFSLDGKVLASGNGNSVIFWNVATGKLTGQTLIGQGASITGVAFSPDGKTFASIDGYSAIMLWDLNTLKPLLSQPLSNTDPDIPSEVPTQTGLAFNPDGTMLAAGGGQSVTLWNMEKHERVVRAFHTLTNDFFRYAFVRGTTFSPDGKELLTLSDTYTSNYVISVWHINMPSWQTLACSIVNRNFTMDEWKQFVGADLPYQKVCSAFPLDSSVIQDELAQAHADLETGKQQDAQAVYARAAQEVTQLDDAEITNNVCWDGSTDNFATVVMPACERAVALDRYYGQYYDSRGLARALTGDTQGAVNDFNTFVQWATDEYLRTKGMDPALQATYKQRIAERATWMHQLEAGQKPFDTKMLQALRIEMHTDG